jgi:hypothetical protein
MKTFSGYLCFAIFLARTAFSLTQSIAFCRYFDKELQKEMEFLEKVP